VKRYLDFVARHPYLLAALCVVLFLPWLWLAALVPPWAILTSLALMPVAACIALALVVRDAGDGEELAPGESADEGLMKWRKRTRLFQQVVIGLDTMLARWDSTSQSSRKQLEVVGESVEEVIRITETAVGEISRHFRVVVAKAREQTEEAMSLLKRDEEGARGVLSLPEFIQAYDQQLVNVTRHMTSFSEAADEMASHQKRISEHAAEMDRTIDGLRDMASQISRIALDGSVAMTSQTVNPRDFIEMTDRIRGISQQAHELTRKTRHGLEAIGDEVRTANRRTTQVAEAARRAVELARAEIGTLNAATIEQTRQIEKTLQRINELSVEIQKDINSIIMAMQFQDITRQKLERLRKPVIGATADSLSLLSHETRALLQRDLYRAVRAYSESAIRPAGAAPEGGDPAGQRLDEAGAAAAPQDRKPSGDKVEIF
jgi:methyl-accepting chemotaxis protein